jgi:hypothetical protein
MLFELSSVIIRLQQLKGMDALAPFGMSFALLIKKLILKDKAK